VVCVHRVLLLLGLSACVVNGKCGCFLLACFVFLYLLPIYGWWDCASRWPVRRLARAVETRLARFACMHELLVLLVLACLWAYSCCCYTWRREEECEVGSSAQTARRGGGGPRGMVVGSTRAPCADAVGRGWVKREGERWGMGGAMLML
jgi:hypothetical protein